MLEQTHDDGLAILSGHGGNPHVHRLVVHPDIESPVLGQALFRNVQPGGELEPQRHRGRDLAVGLGLQVKHAVDAEADLQPPLLGLDVDVGGSHLGSVFEHRLQQLDHGSVFRSHALSQRAEIHVVFAQIPFQLFRQTGNLLGATVDPIDGFQQQPLVDRHQFDIAPQEPRNLVVTKDVGGISHAHHKSMRAVFQNQGAESAGLVLRQLADNVGIDVEMLEIDVGDVELFRQGFGNLVLGDEAVFHQHAPEFAPRALLVVQGDLELPLRDQLLLDQHLTQTDFFRTPHHSIPSF